MSLMHSINIFICPLHSNSSCNTTTGQVGWLCHAFVNALQVLSTVDILTRPFHSKSLILFHNPFANTPPYRINYFLMNQSSTTIPPSPVRKKEQSEGDKSENEKTKMKIGMGYTCVISCRILWYLWGY